MLWPPMGCVQHQLMGSACPPWVSVSRTVRGGGGTLALGEARYCKLEQWADRKFFVLSLASHFSPFLQECKEFTHVDRHKLMSDLS